ncbi:MAG: hypothetical protein ACXWCB_07925 [Acidimicrobiales bacterium]
MTAIDPHPRQSDDHDQRAVLIDEMVVRLRGARPFLLIGSLCTIAGGLVAAVTRPTGFVLGSWTAAFLVLVGGVAQIALGAGQAWLAEQPPPARRVRVEVVCWNTGVAATLVGTLAATPIITTVAGLALVPALALFIATTKAPSSVRRSGRVIYRALAGIVLVSIPIGLGLAWSRHP